MVSSLGRCVTVLVRLLYRFTVLVLSWLALLADLGQGVPVMMRS
jgi:hypothetical protein